MAKPTYKLQEFIAHTADVKCLSIGKKSSRVFATGGDDRKLNLWEVGRSTSLLSLSGHTSTIEICVLVEKLELFNLEVFSCCLPLLAGLLGSTTERHIDISMEMLVKLARVFKWPTDSFDIGNIFTYWDRHRSRKEAEPL